MDQPHASAVPKLTFRVQWLPDSGIYLARVAEFPSLSHADEWSPAAAIAGLKMKIRTATISSVSHP